MRYRLIFILILLMGNFLIFSAVSSGPTLSGLQVHYLDVGQGDATLLVGPTGNKMLIDGGPDRKILTALGRVLPSYDRRIDVVVATHPDADHIGGLIAVLENYDVRYFLTTGATTSTEISRTLERLVTARQIERIVVRTGFVLHFDEQVLYTVLFPNTDVNGWETNKGSIVARVSHGQNDFLFTGDSPQEIELQLVREMPSVLDSEVYKVGHHGSRTSSAESFVRLVSPDYSVISAGLDNRYGHPHPTVLETLSTWGGAVLTTFASGSIQLMSDGETLSIVSD